MATTRYTLAIKELPTHERPRERLIREGAEALSNAELLAIILRVGSTEYSAIGLAEHLLGTFGGLRGIASAQVEGLAGIKGLGLVKAAQIRAMVELGRRIAASGVESRYTISSPQDAVDILMPDLRHEPQENFVGLFLNNRNELIKRRVITVGSLNASIITPRELFREAISCNSASVIIAHNHPSGAPEPSQDDINVTRRLAEAGRTIGIDVLDHLVIGDGVWVSLKERKLM